MNTTMDTPQESALAEILLHLRGLVDTALGNPPEFKGRWEAAVSAFRSWLTMLPTTVSPIAQYLELLRYVELEFKTDLLRLDSRISSLILQGTAKPGEQVVIHGRAWLIISRAISNNYGLEYILKDDQGEIQRHEFFD